MDTGVGEHHDLKVAYTPDPSAPNSYNVTITDSDTTTPAQDGTYSGKVVFNPATGNIVSSTVTGLSVGGGTLTLQNGGTVTLASLGLNTNTNAAPVYNPVSNSMAAYNATTGTGTKPDFSVTIPLADSQGGARSMQIDYLKSTSNPNQWYAEAHVVPASDVVDGGGLSNGQVSVSVTVTL